MAFELLPLKPDQHTVTFVPRLSLELPFFNLTFRKKDTPRVIKYTGRDGAGRPMRWEVYQDTSSEIGAPAVEAHEVWYLLVKPSIDSQRRQDGAIPEIIPLGGIRECLRKVGWTAGGFQARELIKALTQIAFAGCVADLWIPTGDKDREGKEKFLQIKGRFSRMSVYAIGEHHLTEEQLAQRKFDFDLEDILYIRLDPLESKLQQLQDRRVLDNQYLFSLSPAGRRWYELMAAKVFGVVHNNGSFCEIRYSWYIQHHHTLKRYYEHKRVRFQMDRVIKDHIASGYVVKAEYRAAVKEPGREIDYIIRYYPGPGAKDSDIRIQTFIRDRRGRRKHRQMLHEPKTEAAQEIRQPTLALSIVTDEHYDLISDLVLRFRINPLRATTLVLSGMARAKEQVEAWPFRQVKPRSLAGWMIQAIENNYDLPEAYRAHQEEQTARLMTDAAASQRQQCQLCDRNGFRHVRSLSYPRGAMRQCTHDAAIEGRFESFEVPDIDHTSPNA